MRNLLVIRFLGALFGRQTQDRKVQTSSSYMPSLYRPESSQSKETTLAELNSLIQKIYDTHDKWPRTSACGRYEGR